MDTRQSDGLDLGFGFGFGLVWRYFAGALSSSHITAPLFENFALALPSPQDRREDMRRKDQEERSFLVDEESHDVELEPSGNA